MLIEIKNRFTGSIIFAIEAGSMRLAVEAAVRQKINLRAADLRAADLSAANLRAANLSAADLRAADLRAADLSDANLSDANLSAADLRAANLSDANLSAADLRAADLSAADLSDANLSDADLRAADLSDARDDIWAILSGAPKEVAGLRTALIEGRVDGSTYNGDCACLVGTIANIRGVDTHHLGCIKPNSNRPAERFFLAIKKGDKPESSQPCKLAVEWIDEWVSNIQQAFAPVEMK